MVFYPTITLSDAWPPPTLLIGAVVYGVAAYVRNFEFFDCGGGETVIILFNLGYY